MLGSYCLCIIMYRLVSLGQQRRNINKRLKMQQQILLFRSCKTIATCRRHLSLSLSFSLVVISLTDVLPLLCRFVPSARQLAKALEVPLVNDLGYTKRYVRCLQVYVNVKLSAISTIYADVVHL